MNPAFYFENDPWTETSKIVKQNDFGRIAAGSVQEYSASEPLAEPDGG